MRSAYSMKQRKLALVLLDLVGSTAFIQKVGSVKAAKWLQKHDRLARSLCYKHSGREIDRSDGFLMSFENVSDAVSFALQYVKTIPPKTKLEARIGIHWGQIVEVRQGDAFVDAGAKSVELEGISKNIAARTMSLASPSQVLMTLETYQALMKSVKYNLPKDAEIACVGLYKFKGVSAPQELYAVAEPTEYEIRSSSRQLKRLQPPLGTSKAKRLGGPKFIKSRKRKLKLISILLKFTIVVKLLLAWATLYFIYLLGKSVELRLALGVDAVFWWLQHLVDFLEYVWSSVSNE